MFIVPQNLSPSQRFGATYEQWASHRLTEAGYPNHPIALWTDHADLMIEAPTPTYVEVKAARPTMRKVRPRYYRPRWQFDTGRLRQDIDHVVILVCIDDHGFNYPFVCPSWALWARSNISITSHPTHYAGRLAGYLDHWGTVAEVMNRRREGLQLPLFMSTLRVTQKCDIVMADNI